MIVDVSYLCFDLVREYAIQVGFFYFGSTDSSGVNICLKRLTIHFVVLSAERGAVDC